MFIDTHCHLNFKSYKKDLPEVIKRATDNKIDKIIIPGAKLDTSRKAIEIAQQYGDCFAAVGIHPHHADLLSAADNASDLKNLLTGLIIQPKVVAVGEIGLDYYQYKDCPAIDEETKKRQKELFLLQLELAQENNLPVILHCREAFDDLLNVLKDKNISGVFHCFSGNKQQLAEVLEMGFYLGFDGNITYPQNQHLRQLVESAPFDKLLLETDAPFLTPVPQRGNRNEPAFLVYTAQTVAEIKKTALDKVMEITCSNALKLFRLPA
ncbi:TatD family hydrolase [Candidatus Microgenomates bacterium]|nr:TatD family hydrolase [Candidatus Microgenomates bacterium]